MEHRYLLTLRGKDGRTAALLRLKQGQDGYQAERRDYVPLPGEAALWLLTPAGPVPAGEAKPGPVLGAALAEDGRCLCAGVARGAKIDLGREMQRLRILLQAEIAPMAKAAPGADAAASETLTSESETKPAPVAMEEETAEAAPQEECAETPANAIEEEEAPTAAEASAEATDSPDEEPAVPVMAILPEPLEENPDGWDPGEDVNKEVELPLNTITNERLDSWEEAATEESYGNIPEGAEEVSGREYGWTAVEEEERRAVWIAGETKVELNAEYDVDPDIQETEYRELPEGRSEALQDILARAERAFSDHVPPSPTPVLAESVEVVAGPAADPVQAREGLAMAIPNPFPNTFPGAAFRRVHRPQGQGWYLQGEMRRGNERWRITAMPGEYRPIPPCALQGFHRYIKSRDGGYWLRIERG